MSSSSAAHIPLTYNSVKIEDLMTHTSEIPTLTDQFENCLNGGYFIPLGPGLSMQSIIEQAAQGEELGVINIVKLPQR